MFFSVVTVDSEAYDFIVDGIYYKKVSESNKCIVTHKGSQYDPQPSYSGNIIIPSTVFYDGADYCVTSIGNMAFLGCEELTSVSLPNSIVDIEERAFSDCISLTSVILSDSLNNIGKSAFSGCRSLTSIVIPPSVTAINASTFSGCKTLSKVIVTGKKLNSIDAEAFGYPVMCPLSKLVFCSEIPPSLLESKYTPLPDTTKIIVPQSCIKEYKEAFGEHHTYLPLVLSDITFYDQASLQDYLISVEEVNADTVTSVAFYGGMDSKLTEKWLKMGMNPNCLYYVYSDDIMESDNVINLKDCTADNIVLQDGFPFKCPATFTAKKATYTYTPSIWADGKNGWEAVCLPYEVRNFRASTKGALSPILLGTDGNFWLREFVGASSDELYFTSTYDGVMKAYTPYIVAFPGSKMGKNNIEGQSVSFIGKDVVVGADQPAIVQRNDFIFKGGFDTDADEGTGWILNSNGDGFEKTDVVGNNPFHAYFMTDNDDTAAGAKRLSISTEFVEEEGTLVSSVKLAEESLEVVADEGAVIIKANSNTTVNIYGANGALLRCVRINAGENKVEGLAKGLYIINKQKILIR